MAFNDKFVLPWLLSLLLVPVGSSAQDILHSSDGKRLEILHSTEPWDPEGPEARFCQIDSALHEPEPPPLPHTRVVGHFVFSYTDHNADERHNVSLGDILAIGKLLNTHWNKFTAMFTEPIHHTAIDGRKLINVKVYNRGKCDATAEDFTIILDSVVVKDRCLIFGERGRP